MGDGWTGRVTIAIATYKRAELLERLVASILACADLTALRRIVVIDNDPAESARPVWEAAADPRVEYRPEPTPGIAAVRNASLDVVDDADVALVFVDDDEHVPPEWFGALVAYARESDADVVTGPVVPDYGTATPRWIVDGGFWVRAQRTTGTELEDAATNNTLVTTRCLRASQGLRFDPRVGRMGGSDTDFFRRLRPYANRYVWCEAAALYEVVLPSRANARWLFRRAVRLGNVSARHSGGRLSAVASGCARIGVGSVLVARDLIVRRAPGARGFTMVGKGVGRIGEAIGRPVIEYARKPVR